MLQILLCRNSVCVCVQLRVLCLKDAECGPISFLTTPPPSHPSLNKVLGCSFHSGLRVDQSPETCMAAKTPAALWTQYLAQKHSVIGQCCYQHAGSVDALVFNRSSGRPWPQPHLLVGQMLIGYWSNTLLSLWGKLMIVFYCSLVPAFYPTAWGHRLKDSGDQCGKLSWHTSNNFSSREKVRIPGFWQQAAACDSFSPLFKSWNVDEASPTHY